MKGSSLSFRTRHAWLVLFAAVLQACGGGGDAPPAPPAPPSAPVITASPATPKPNESVTLTASSTGRGVTYAWTFGDGTTGSGASVTHTYTAEGSFSLSVVATSSDALTANGSSTLNVVAVAPGEPTLTLSDNAPYPGESINLTVASTDPQGSTLTYKWDFGDGQVLAGTSQPRTYAAEGSYPVTVTVTNQFGKSVQKTFTIPVVFRAPVVAGHSIPATAMPRQTIAFGVAATDVQGSPLSYAWDFGDGHTATGSGTAHAYDTDGTFQVKVVVSSALGKSTTVSTSVAVVAQPPTIAFVTGTRATPRPLEVDTFNVGVTDPQGATMTYLWTFGDGATATTPTASHSWTAEGSYAVKITVTNSWGKSSSLSLNINVVAVAPSMPVVTLQPDRPKPGDLITFTTTPSTDPQGSAVTYQWVFGDGATASGITATHTYSAVGTYTVQATATNSYGKSSTRAIPLLVDYRPPDPPVISPATIVLAPGATGSFTAASVDPGGYAVSYSWDFGDGSAVVSGGSQTHSYASAGRYTITVTATNTINKSSTATATAGVAPSTADADNEFGVYCRGANCGALDAGNYLGAGRGIWRYRNTTGAAATINITIAGPLSGKRALMVFSNGGTASTSLPDIGVSASPMVEVSAGNPAPTAAAVAADRLIEAHGEMLERNRRLALDLIRQRGPSSAPAQTVLAAPLSAPPPAVGTARTWTDYYVSPGVPYNTTVVATCSSPGTGRNIVFWVDPTLTSFNAARVDAFRNAFCGADGAFDKVTGLIGNAWGAVPAGWQTTLISDAPELQDINIIFPNVPTGTGWGGYFYGGNSFQSNSNHALAFFVNGPGASASPDYYISVLAHELTHMVNFYQRAIVRGASHDTWLEETSATMSEDIVVPQVMANGFNTVRLLRVPSVYNSGGAVSLINWVTLSDAHYSLGGSLGGFLSRRYGVPMFQALIGCGTTPATTGTSHRCVDALIRDQGGVGYEDEFARLGASVYARIGSKDVPPGFGYPALSSGGFSLQGYPLETSLGVLRAAASLSGNLPAASHTYNADTLPANATNWARSNVVVPPNSTLVVVID